MKVIPKHRQVVEARSNEQVQVPDMETAGMLALLIAERLKRRLTTPDQAAFDLVSMAHNLRHNIDPCKDGGQR